MFSQMKVTLAYDPKDEEENPTYAGNLESVLDIFKEIECVLFSE